jgi:hypothetical protein
VIRSRLAVTLPLLVGLCADAEGARRRFAWLWDTEVSPQRGVELEWWIWETAGASERAWLLVSTVVGLTDNLELGVPVVVVWSPDTGTELDGYGLDARWRLGSADPAKAGPVVALLRAGARRQIQAGALRLEGGATLSLDLGRLRAVADADVVYGSDRDDVSAAFGAGLSYRVTEELFVGVESYGVARFGEDGGSWFSVGPNLSFTWGRFWLTASLPIGIDADAPDLLPRVIWATAF